jgi:hypothetical protein
MSSGLLLAAAPLMPIRPPEAVSHVGDVSSFQILRAVRADIRCFWVKRFFLHGFTDRQNSLNLNDPIVVSFTLTIDKPYERKPQVQFGNRLRWSW